MAAVETPAVRPLVCISASSRYGCAQHTGTIKKKFHPLVGLALALTAACSERPVTEPELEAERHLPPTQEIAATLSCTANLEEQTLACAALDDTESFPGPSLDIVGGQGVYVQLTSSDVSYDDEAEVFYADVTVQNLMSRRLGTPDGSTVTGVRVFFHSGPNVTSGSGTVTVRNPDGSGSFTNANQPYHEYAEMLGTDETTAPKTWEWDVPPSVLTFEFEVFVEADSYRPIAVRWGIGGGQSCAGTSNLWTCLDRETFTVTEGSGDLEVWATGAPGSSYQVVPDRITTSLSVSPRMRYEVSLNVRFKGPGWLSGRQPPSWPCASVAVTSAGEPPDTAFASVYPVFDNSVFPPVQVCAAQYELLDLSGQLLGVADTARAGDWEAAADFGEFVFTVNEDGSAITQIDYTFDDFSCSGNVASGNEDFAGDWAITDHRFAIENTNPANGDVYRVQGEFDQDEVHASGTWELVVSGSSCTGSWVGQWNLRPTATIYAPAEGASYRYGEVVEFSGGATDPEDGQLTGGALVWQSSLDDQIGTGESFSRDDLSLGNHRIVLTARDSDGWSGRDTVHIVIRPTEDFTTGLWHAITDFGQMSFVVNPERTGITQIMYDLDHFTCGWEEGYWWYGDGTLTEPYPGWPITEGSFDIENTLVDPDLWIAISGEFALADRAVGTWTAFSRGTYCWGSWEGGPATNLFLRAGSTPFLAAEQDPNPTARSRSPSGAPLEFAATLDQALPGESVVFWLWLRADSGGVSGGDFDVALLVSHDGSETQLAGTTFSIPADTLLIPFLDVVTGSGGGVAGDQLILRITYDGNGWGDVAYGRDYGSHVVIPGRITVSMPPGSASSPLRSVAPHENDVRRGMWRRGPPGTTRER